jgi:Uma2 family endonuclease
MATTTGMPSLTFEQFERLPETPGKRELLEGELIELPAAEMAHNELGEELHARLKSGLADAHGRGEAAELGKAHMRSDIS